MIKKKYIWGKIAWENYLKNKTPFNTVYFYKNYNIFYRNGFFIFGLWLYLKRNKIK